MKALQRINTTKDQIMLQQKAEIKMAASLVSYPLQHALFINSLQLHTIGFLIINHSFQCKTLDRPNNKLKSIIL